MDSQDKSTPTIGIVIPIYNVAKYLRECLDSVANQSYGNFCAVLVNDGSTDNSKEIALEYVVKDSRFVLIDKENGGLSSARNVGIAWFNDEIESSLRGVTNAESTTNPPKIDYIIFLDSDDSWESDLLEKCVDSALKHKADIIWFDHAIFYDDDMIGGGQPRIATGYAHTA